jgi:hypothetical protein
MRLTPTRAERPGGVREPPVGHMRFCLIVVVALLFIVVALLFGLTPTAGASEARLSSTRLLVTPSAGEINTISISSTSTRDGPHILVEDLGAPEEEFQGIGAGSGCTQGWKFDADTGVPVDDLGYESAYGPES